MKLNSRDASMGAGVAGDPTELADWNALQDLYHKRTGYFFVVVDTNGSIRLGAPNCEHFPCMKSCRQCREDIIRESLRTGRVCVDICHQGYCLWGLPVQQGGRLIGGVVVFGGQMAVGEGRKIFEAACAELHQLMGERDLLPASQQWLPLSGSGSRFVQRQAFEAVGRDMDVHGRALIQAMKTAEFAEARAASERLRVSWEALSVLPMDVVRGLIADFILRARHELVASGVDAYASFAEVGELMKDMGEAVSGEAIEAMMRRFLERFEFLLSQGQKAADDLLVERATTYLEEHLREELDRDGVARAVGISPSHFSRLLRERKGRTFTDLLAQYRIERACGLLVRTSKTLAEIAGEAGFCDQSYFSKVFKRYKGQTPRRYREEHSP